MVEAICMLILEEDAARTRISSPHLSRYLYNIAFSPLVKKGHFSLAAFILMTHLPYFASGKVNTKFPECVPLSTLRYDHFCRQKVLSCLCLLRNLQCTSAQSESSLLAWYRLTLGAVMPVLLLSLPHGVRSVSNLNQFVRKKDHQIIKTVFRSILIFMQGLFLVKSVLSSFEGVWSKTVTIPHTISFDISQS